MGFEVYNAAGILQVDQDNKVLDFYWKYGITISYPSVSGKIQTGFQNLASPLVVIGNTGTSYIHCHYTADGYLNYSGSANGISGSVVVIVYLFGAPSAPTVTAGLALYNSAGELVFNYSKANMRITAYSTASLGASVGIPSNSGVIVPPFVLRTLGSAGAQGYYIGGNFINVSGNVFSSKPIPIGVIPDTSYPPQAYVSSVNVVSVNLTGL